MRSQGHAGISGNFGGAGSARGQKGNSGHRMFTRKSVCNLALFLGFFATVQTFAQAPPIEFDHAWIVVLQGAPERAALEKAGFTISPNVNRHDGQGTASVTIEFENAFLELMWPDPTVSVAPGAERGVEKFRQRMLWRTSGWSPIGLGFRHTTPADPTFSFPTWSVSPGWLPKGSAIEILTPRDDSTSPSLFVTPRALAVDEKMNGKTADRPSSSLVHGVGVHRVTGVHLTSPTTYKPIAPLDYLQKLNLVTVDAGKEWALELELDRGAKGQSKDLHPELPLIIRY